MKGLESMIYATALAKKAGTSRQNIYKRLDKLKIFCYYRGRRLCPPESVNQVLNYRQFYRQGLKQKTTPGAEN